MQTYRKVFVSTLLVILTFMVAGSFVQAQPVLNFKRIVNNWPTVELYFTVACNGQPEYNFNPLQNLEVHDNGIEIGTFTLWCPDPRQRCAVSVALVFDASGSMSGVGNAGAKAAGNAFVDLMDGLIDEAAIIWFTSAVTVRLGMTVNLTDLHTAINSLPASGATAVWDGIYVGIQELINSGNNPCRAVIAITDGNDNSSTRTPQDIISLARENRIRVFTIGLGGVHPAQLETIALLTGGKYYQAPSANQLVAIYEEISTIIFGGFLECLITYQASCMDGNVRTVDLTLKNFCNGTDTKTKSFRAPLDSTSFESTTIICEDVSQYPAREVTVALRKNDLKANIYAPFTTQLNFDHDVCSYQGFSTMGTELNLADVSVQETASGLEITTTKTVQVDGSLPLLLLTFRVNNPPLATLSTALDLDAWSFDHGCLTVILDDGSITVKDESLPFLIAGGNLRLCAGDSLLLECSPGFTDHLWSTGETTSSIYVKKSGEYWVRARKNAGPMLDSDTMEVTVSPLPEPSIFPSGSVSGCRGNGITVECTEHFDAYRWSNGNTERSITTFKSGIYYVDVRTADGCWGRSDSVEIQIHPTPEPSIIGATAACVSDSIYTYRVNPVAGHLYSWSITGGVILGNTNTPEVQVKWTASATGSISILQTDQQTGCLGSDNMNVTVGFVIPTLSHQGVITLCEGDTLFLKVNEDYDSYRWNSGTYGQVDTIMQPGVYYCDVNQGGCVGTTESVTVMVIGDSNFEVVGPAFACEYGSGTYEVTEIPGATYTWIAQGGNVIAGSGTHSVEIQWLTKPASSVLVLLEYQGCTATDSIEVSIRKARRPEISVVGDTVICAGDRISLIAENGFTNYRWSNGSAGQTLIVSTSGSYNVRAIDVSGCPVQSRNVVVLVLNNPPTPDIVRNGNELRCTTVGVLYQWYLDGVLLHGETNATITITQNGKYSVKIVNSSGCASISDEYNTVGIDRLPTLAKKFVIAPNPNNGSFTLDLEFDQATSFSLRVVDITGNAVFEERINSQGIHYHKQLAIDGLPSGIYFLTIESGNHFDRKKFVIQNN
jgi:von Willebrand factor type A domain-containing protein/type IX secretion system substrate protein/PKD domain-containing protein